MSDAFDELERQLRRAVSATQGARGRPRRHWRRTTVFAVAATLLVSGAALAATQLTGTGQNAETQGRKIAFEAVTATAHTAACRPNSASGSLVLSDGPVLAGIADALPALAVPASPGARAKAKALLPTHPRPSRAVLSRTLRVIPLQQGLSVLVYVQLGEGQLADPAACAQARLDRAHTLAKGRPAAARAWAERRLAELRDTATDLQTLWEYARIPGRPGSVGSGTPVRAGERLHPGLLSFGSDGHGRRVYVGITGRRTTHVIISANRRARSVPARIPVRDGFYALVLPSGTGPTRLSEVTAGGAVVRVVKLRELPKAGRLPR